MLWFYKFISLYLSFMKTQTNTKGFTLVELLVVITIIGILATGAIAMFTGAQQKARDSVRVTDIQAIKLSVEQYYGDNAEYPNAGIGAGALNGLASGGYIDRLPKDPKTGQMTSTTRLVYVYGSSYEETTTVQGQEFELSAHFENQGNLDSKATNTHDSGDDNNRWEVGVNVDHVFTDITAAGAANNQNEHIAGTAANPYIIDTNASAT